MSAYSFAQSRAIPTPEKPDSIDVTETYWGPVLRERDMAEAIIPTTEKAMRILGALAVLAAVGFWVLPGVDAFGQSFEMRMMLTGVLGSLGMVLLQTPDAERAEVQFDTLRREVRFAARRDGRTKGGSILAMDHVTGIEVEAVVPGSEFAAMKLRVDGVDEGLLVVSGRRSDLEPVAQRLRRDIRRPSERVESRLGARAL